MTDHRDHDIGRLIASAVAEMVPADGKGGVAVAVRGGGRTHYFSYGLADSEESLPVTPDSLFNIASVRKVMEAALLAQAAARGDVRLNDPVAKYVGELHGGYIRQVTLGELATHTSGLLLPADHPPWPTTRYSRAGFFDALNAWTPPEGVAPGKQRIYTHAGYVLLQLALERRFSTPIGEQIAHHILKPLGLTSTILPEHGADGRAKLSPALMRRVVQGYSENGEPIGLPGNQQTYYDFPGTGQMFSSVRDLATLVAASLGEGHSDPSLRAALAFTQHVALRISPDIAQAMAWEVMGEDGGVTVVDKPGGLNNASAYIGIVPERKIGLVILSNRGNQYPHEVARKVILPALARM